ncbi:MAG: hypothetical protein JSV32_05800 [Dehalococcoidia bacterium]|nr:MAG: hypothetical protein JSV32_05800 [Dehalococcoidia bacterium]
MSTILQAKTSHLTWSEDEVIWQLKENIARGKHWYIALLEAIGRWEIIEEAVDGRSYQYLINGEAFDWLLLAERLCQIVSNLLPKNEKEALLFYGRPPLELTAGEFKKLIGNHKYSQHLNYFYGITAEEALLQATEDEVRKERFAYGGNNQQDITDEAYRRIYGIVQQKLLKLFRREKNYRHSRSINLTQLKEFTYWLFKYRLKQCEKARIGSDTEKAIKWLKNNGSYSEDRNR